MIAKTPNIRCFVAKTRLSWFTRLGGGGSPKADIVWFFFTIFPIWWLPLNWRLQLHLHRIVPAHSGWVFATVGRIIRWNNSAGKRRHVLLSLKVGVQGIILRVRCYALMSQSPPKPKPKPIYSPTSHRRPSHLYDVARQIDWQIDSSFLIREWFCIDFLR